MKDKKNVLYIVIGILFFIILILFILLFIPLGNEKEKYSSQDYINVKNNILEDNSINIDEIQENLSTSNNSILNEDIEEVFNEEDYFYNQEILGNLDSSEYYDESQMFLGTEGYGVSEEYVKNFVDINYFEEDCLFLISKNINGEDLLITPDEGAGITHSIDCYGTEGFFRLFDVYNQKTNTTEDSIAINVVTGDMFGYSPERILYDYDIYKYNPDLYKNLEKMFENGETFTPYDLSDLWERIGKTVSSERYGSARITHIKDSDGTHYNKIYWDDIDDYILVDYYTGEMTQVVDGVESSIIDAFK